jgi:hypothetical protein
MPSIHARQSLTPRLQRLAAMDPQTRGVVDALTPDEIGILTALARGEQDANVALPPHRAMGLLAIAATPDVAIPVLEQVARNASAEATSRVAAVRGLGRIATPETQALLLAHATGGHARVQQAALAALGLFANRSALVALQGVTPPIDESARRQLALTRALIAHREGLSGPFLPEREGVRREAIASNQMNEVTLAMKSAEATTADLAKLTGPTYGIQLAARGYDLRCGRAEWTIFGNAALGGSITADSRLFERSWILALVARWQPVGIAAAVQYVVLSRPVGRSVRLDVARADGEVAYTGSAQPSGPALSFTISDVDRPATSPTTLTGVLDAGSARLDVAIVHATRVATRKTQPARPN